MAIGRRCQLAHPSGVSPLASFVSMTAPASSRMRILTVVPNAAARCNGVSPLVTTSRIKVPVSTLGFVTAFTFAPPAMRTRKVSSHAGRSSLLVTAWSAVFARVWLGGVRIVALLDQELTEPMMGEERGIEQWAFSDRRQCLTLCNQIFDGREITVIDTRLHQ